MNNWNVLIRWENEAHFKPLWTSGVSEDTARDNLRWYLNDSYWRRAEYQLVTDYSYHFEENVSPVFGTTTTTREAVMDSWTAVPI